jgi:hypothetical protein
METKQLLTVEFRYNDKENNQICKTITIGVYDTLNEAIVEGNKQLELLESKFSLHKFPNGKEANKNRFSLNGGCYGSKKTLVTNLAYLKTPFDFFFKITELKYSNILDVIEDFK